MSMNMSADGSGDGNQHAEVAFGAMVEELRVVCCYLEYGAQSRIAVTKMGVFNENVYPVFSFSEQ